MRSKGEDNSRVPKTLDAVILHTTAKFLRRRQDVVNAMYLVKRFVFHDIMEEACNLRNVVLTGRRYLCENEKYELFHP